MKTYEGPVLVVVGDALLEADAVFTECDGFWGGFTRMHSIAGAEIVMEANPGRRSLTFDGVAAYPFSPRRTNERSPVLRITGLGPCPFP